MGSLFRKTGSLTLISLWVAEIFFSGDCYFTSKEFYSNSSSKDWQRSICFLWKRGGFVTICWYNDSFYKNTLIKIWLFRLRATRSPNIFLVCQSLLSGDSSSSKSSRQISITSHMLETNRFSFLVYIFLNFNLFFYSYFVLFALGLTRI